MALTKSQNLFKKARQVMVGGVNSPVRSFISVGGNPLVIKSGRGAKIFDADGQGFTDYCLSWGALVLGHAHKDVLAAVKKTIARGTSYGTTTALEIELAKQIVKDVPSIDKVRFVSSGTEATMSAIRLARGFTKRDLVVKFDGCYHGHFDDLLISAGSGVAKLKKSSSLGVPKSHIENTLSVPYNDTAVLVETLTRFKDKIACVIIEPVAGNMGVVPAGSEFLKMLRELTKKYGIVLIFDEVMSGYRSSRGCVQSDVSIIPDMTCLGKIIGGGFPIGAYGGRDDIMKNLAPMGGVYQAGTFSGNPIVMIAGLATLKNLSKLFYQDLNLRTAQFASALNYYFKEHSIPAFLSSYNSMMSIRFQPVQVFNYAQAQGASSNKIYGELFYCLLKEGIYWPPANLEAFFISSVHTQNDLAKLTKILQQFLRNKSC